MYQQIEDLPESVDLSPTTQAHLKAAHLELQIRVQEVEHSLTTFCFDDAHSAREDRRPTARAASLKFRKFLKQYYEQEYQAWPIKSIRQDKTWLNRRITSRLQHDFSALYEYCVDKEVKWDEDEDEDDKKHERIRGRETPKTRRLLKSNTSFSLDAEDDRMLSIFRNLDCRYNRPSLPHPYPILPASIPVSSSQSKRFVFSKGHDKNKVGELRIAHAYATANNSFQWNREYASNGMSQAFCAFEKADSADNVNPQESRRERWIIIYCVLQALAGISVDVPQLSFKGDVDYFLNARLEGLPPWSVQKDVYLEASREQSHCFTAAEAWADSRREQDTSIQSPGSSNSVTRSESSHDSRPRSSESQSSSSTPLALLPASQVLTFPSLNGSHCLPNLGRLTGNSHRTDFGSHPSLGPFIKNAPMTIPSLLTASLPERPWDENRNVPISLRSRENDHPIPPKFGKVARISESDTQHNEQPK